MYLIAGALSLDDVEAALRSQLPDSSGTAQLGLILLREIRMLLDEAKRRDREP